MAINFDSYSFFDGSSQTAVTQVSWSDYWRGVIPDGVVAGVGNEMKPLGYSGGMVIKVLSGACMVDNHRGVLNSEKELTIAAAHATKPRIDLLVARVVYGNTNSKIVLDIKTGTAATAPEPPALVQSTGSTYEIKLAEIYVKPQTEEGYQTIPPEAVTDFRNVFECGEQAFAFQNTDTEALVKGMVVTLDHSSEGGVKRCKAAEVPVGVVASENIAPGGTGQIDTKPGTISDVRCTAKAVGIGDALVVSPTDGLAESGGGMAAALALQAKAAGVIANVKSLLTVFARIPYQNAWYILDGIGEDQVIAAYQFVNRRSMSEALININQGLEYELSPQSSSITWAEETGFTFPTLTQSNQPLVLSNSSLGDTSTGALGIKVKAAAFGYKLESWTTGKLVGGICPSFRRALLIRGFTAESAGGPVALNKACIYQGNTMGRRSTSTATAGVLGGNWNGSSNSTPAPAIFTDGTNTTYATGITFAGNTEGIFSNSNGVIGQPAISGTTPFRVTAVAFYNKVLTAAQHLQLANQIAALGGIDN